LTHGPSESLRNLTGSVLGMARVLGLYGWDEATAAQYAKRLAGKCDLEQARQAAEEIFGEHNRLPEIDEILARCGAVEQQDRGSPIYLRAADGFCYAERPLMRVSDRETVNGRATGRRLVREAVCGCVRCRPQDWCRISGCMKRCVRGQAYCPGHADEPEAHGVGAGDWTAEESQI
jgi:hypothetical protein